MKRVVYAGSSSVYGDRTAAAAKHETDLPDPVSPYAAAKVAGELYCQAFTATYGLATVTVRYFNVFGPRQDPNERIRGRDPEVRHEDARRRAADDLRRRQAVARFHVRRERRRRQSAGGRACRTRPARRSTSPAARQFDLLDLVAAINRVLGTKIEPIFEPPRAGDVRDSLADISLASKVLGYEPVIDFDEGLRRSIDYYRTLAKK